MHPRKIRKKLFPSLINHEKEQYRIDLRREKRRYDLGTDISEIIQRVPLPNVVWY
jgi:hypothetical protein